MNRLTINHGSFNLDEIDLDHGTVTIGRAVDNDIRLDDSAVSSHHAKIVTFFNVTYIEDLDSTNGTIVNGRAIKKYTLRTGDIVLLGKHQLLFQGTTEGEIAGKGDATMVMTQADVKDAIANTPDKTPPAAAEAISAKSAPVAPTPATPTPVTSTPRIPASPSPAMAPAPSAVRPSANTGAAPYISPRQERSTILKNSPPPASPPMPESANPVNRQKSPEPQINTNQIESAPIIEKKEPAISDSFDSLQKHNEAFSLLNDPAPDRDEHAANRVSNEAKAFTAFDKDESLIIPAFIKAEQTSVNIPAIDLPPEIPRTNTSAPASAKAPPPATPPPSIRTNNSGRAPVAEMPNRAAAPNLKPHEKMTQQSNEQFATERVANERIVRERAAVPKKPMAAPPPPVQKRPPQRQPPPPVKERPPRKVLEDPSVSFGEPIQHSTPMGINEVDRVNQYQQRHDASDVSLPAVGDRTLLKQIITGDNNFTPSRNKFEIVQIILGFVIFAIIALIAFESF